MPRIFYLGVALAIVLGTMTSASADAQKPAIVKLITTPEGYQLTRDGKPYFIRGVGGSTNLELLAKLGGNSIRTWGTEGLDKILDAAQKQGLTVAVGIWLGHERHGFNYNDADQVARQLDTARQAILRYKDHPAVLLWGIGNEMEGLGKGDNAAIWSAINNIATMAKRLDPNHPTMTVVAEIGGDRVKNIHRFCPDIDLIGINSYAGLPSLPKRYREAGGKKPFVITEFGPPGTWELPKNEWGAVPEPTSTKKADYYRKSYKEGILGAPGLCLGSYAFLWGTKQEATATWFGILLPDGRRLAAADALQKLWTDKAPRHPCPQLDSLVLDGPDQVDPDTLVSAKLSVSSADEGKLQVRWVLQGDPAIQGIGGDQEEVPPTFPDAILKGDLKEAQVRMPKGGGGYRLFAYVEDEHSGAAVANVALLVKGPVVAPKARVAKLPLVLYDESDRANEPYNPSGFMGNHKSLRLESDCTDKPYAGKTCLKITYADKEGWAGVVWQSPANNWGDRPGGWNLTGARKLTFWARGGTGGEVVAFEFGLLGKEKKYPDSANGKLEGVKLSTEWRQYTIELGERDLSRIQTGFACVIAGQGRPVVVYLDDVRYE